MNWFGCLTLGIFVLLEEEEGDHEEDDELDVLRLFYGSTASRASLAAWIPVNCKTCNLVKHVEFMVLGRAPKSRSVRGKQGAAAAALAVEDSTYCRSLGRQRTPQNK